MQADTLRYLADTANLSRLDFAVSRLLLSSDERGVHAYYAGAYSAGERTVARPPDVPEFAIEVDAQRFQAIAGVFAEGEEVQLRRTPTALRLRSAHHHFTLQCFPPNERGHALPPTYPVIATVSVADLLPEVEIASDCSARSIAVPILTGVRLVARQGRLGVQAYNGYSALFSAVIAAEGVEDTAAIVVPAKDLLHALRHCAHGTVRVGIVGEGRQVGMQGEDAWFIGTTLTGEWPAFRMQSPDSPYHPLTLTSTVLTSLTSAVKIFQAHAEVELLGTDSGVVLRTQAAEAGQYVTRAAGSWRGTVRYDAADLAFAGRLGEAVTLSVPDDPTRPTRLTQGHRTLWITPRVS